MAICQPRTIAAAGTALTVAPLGGTSSDVPGVPPDAPGRQISLPDPDARPAREAA